MLLQYPVFLLSFLHVTLTLLVLVYCGLLPVSCLACLQHCLIALPCPLPLITVCDCFSLTVSACLHGRVCFHVHEAAVCEFSLPSKSTFGSIFTLHTVNIICRLWQVCEKACSLSHAHACAVVAPCERGITHNMFNTFNWKWWWQENLWPWSLQARLKLKLSNYCYCLCPHH